MLEIIKDIPDGFLSIKPTELYKILPDLSLVHIRGQKKQPLFLSCMLHGNEHTGFFVLQELLKKYGADNWPRSVYCLFGNVTAAKENRRHLDNQPDYNRIWQKGSLKQNKRALSILDFLKRENLFASIDIHNNSGRNPHYSVVMDLDKKKLNLAGLFSNRSMLFEEKVGACTENVSEFCPAVTVEAGLSGKTEGTKHVCEYVDKILNFDVIPEKPISKLGLLIMYTVGTVKIGKDCSVGFGKDKANIVFKKNLDSFNFKKIPAGTIFGLYQKDCRLCFNDQRGNDIGDEYFAYKDGKIIIKKALIPGMISQDKRILKSDCVCYVLKEMNFKP